MYKSGSLVATNANISGNIIASSGSIGGWDISPGSLWSGSNDTYVSLNSSNDNDYAFWAGNENPENANFSVTKKGAVLAQEGKIGNWSLGDATHYTVNSFLATVSFSSQNTYGALYSKNNSTQLIFSPTRLVYNSSTNGTSWTGHSFAWKTLTNSWANLLDFQTGYCEFDVKDVTKDAWVWQQISSSNLSSRKFIILTTAMFLNETDIESATINTCFRREGNSTYSYFIGLRRSSKNHTSVYWVAIPEEYWYW